MSAGDADDDLPLRGILVVDFSTLLPGPLASLTLLEAGAEVIKVERPGGEDLRGFAPFVGGVSAPFAALNAGKRFVALDLKDEAQRARLNPLLARADVLIEGFRPGVMDRLGLGYEALSAANPGLIYCSISGYGATGPRAGEAGHDLTYMARSGLLSLSPGPLDAPTVPPALVADIAGGTLPAVAAIALALVGRARTGRGRRLDVAMTDGLFTFAWLALAQASAGGGYPGARDTLLTGASPRYRLYRTADDRLLAVAALEDRFWLPLCAALDLPEALRGAGADPEIVAEAVAARVRARTAAQWAALLDPADLCCAVVATLDEAARDPQFTARGLTGGDAPKVGTGERAVPLAHVPLPPELRRTRRTRAPVGSPGADQGVLGELKPARRPAPPA